MQTVLRMPNDGELILTWAKLHAPSGYAMHGLGIVPTICTAGSDHDVDTLVKSAFDPKARWKHMLAIRRNYADATPAERKEVRAYCPAPTKGENPLDLTVAEKLLAVQKEYMETIQIAQSANGL